MAHMNGLINIINNMSVSINEITQKIRKLEEKITNRNDSDVDDVYPIESEIDNLKLKIERLEHDIRELVSKERMIIENSIMLKTEEIIKRLVKEKVSIESEMLFNDVKNYVNEIMNESDNISVAQSEIKSLTQKKKGPMKKLSMELV